MTQRPRVAIVFGGTSAEHGISCLTAASVAKAIDPARYEVIGVGIATDGRWVVIPGEEVAGLQVRDRTMPQVPSSPAQQSQSPETQSPETQAPETQVPATDTRPGPAPVQLPDLSDIDVAFSLIHGPFGEDGTIQGLFEMLGIRYVGSGVLASAAGMDKHYMKVLMAHAGVQVGPYVAITARQWANDRLAALESVRQLDFPVFVKPARAGSSFGITRVGAPEDLVAAVESAHRYDPKVIVEQGFVGARELECGVLDTGQSARASEVAEIIARTDSGFYDFDAKYLPGEETHADVPAQIPPEIADRVRQLSVTVFEALGCEGLARVDFFLTADGELYCNEINTMPGFTATSMYPRMWAETGVDYPTLVDTLIRQGLERPLGLR